VYTERDGGAFREGAAESELRRRNRELSILNAIAREVNRSGDLDALLRSALARTVDLMNLKAGWVWLLNESTGEPYLAAAQNLPPGLAGNPRRMEGGCYCLDTYRAGDMRGAANVNVVGCSRLAGLVDGTGGLRYHSSIPLYAGRKKLGVLNVASPEWRRLSPEELQLLYTVGDFLGVAVERARLSARNVRLGAVEERNRLAREIHDTLAQGLTAAALQLETADALMEMEPGRARTAVRRALELTRAGLEEARRSVMDLRAAPLEDSTLPEALRRLAEEAGERGGLRVELRATGEHRPLPVRVETGIYRICQEALANVVRHAGARKVSIELTAEPGSVRLVVEDDGAGFDPGRIPEGRFGLVGLNERVRLLGGELNLESTPGTGTRVEVALPLEGS
jgi:two-component system NarL family sensor kinase